MSVKVAINGFGNNRLRIREIFKWHHILCVLC